MSLTLKVQADGYSKQYMESEGSGGEQHIPLVLHACKKLLCREKEISLAKQPS